MIKTLYYLYIFIINDRPIGFYENDHNVAYLVEMHLFLIYVNVTMIFFNLDLFEDEKCSWIQNCTYFK